MLTRRAYFGGLCNSACHLPQLNPTHTQTHTHKKAAYYQREVIHRTSIKLIVMGLLDLSHQTKPPPHHPSTSLLTQLIDRQDPPPPYTPTAPACSQLAVQSAWCISRGSEPSSGGGFAGYTQPRRHHMCGGPVIDGYPKRAKVWRKYQNKKKERLSQP